MLAAGFARVEIAVKETSRDLIAEWVPGSGAEDYVVSANITAWKAAGASASASASATNAHDHSHGHAHHGHTHAHAHDHHDHHDPADAALRAALVEVVGGAAGGGAAAAAAMSYPKVRKAVERALGRRLDAGEKDTVQEFLMEAMDGDKGKAGAKAQAKAQAKAAPPAAPAAGVAHDHGHAHGHAHEHAHAHATAAAGDCCGCQTTTAQPQPAAGSPSAGDAGGC